MTEISIILIIDDNIDDRILCKRCLGKNISANLQILEASNGESGLNVLEDNIPDVILLDYSLPGRNGIEVLKRIRAKHPYIPVIMLTGQGNEEIAVQVMKEGAQDYITKSNINKDSLYRIIKIAVEHCEMQQKIDEQQKALSLFTRALAHDLKEPVRTIRSFLKLLKKESKFFGKSLNYFNRISIAANNMSNLIDSVFTYTRLADATELKMQKCNMNEVIKNVMINLGQQIKESGAKIVYDKLPFVHANETQMTQLFQNLISNAINYTETNSVIKISATEGNKIVEFKVQDNGAGIAEENLYKIFEPFKRFNSNNNKGSGLGLAICQKIVEKHGGEICCESSVNEGATFSFSLSKSGIDNLEEIKYNNTSLTAGKTTEKLANVLLVDDSSADAELTRILLMEESRLEFNLFTAINGKEAIEFIENPSNPLIHLILLDVNMPIMDGFEFLKYLDDHQELRKNLGIIMCSTSNYDDDIYKAKKLGVVDYIQKPATLENTSQAIGKLKNIVLVKTGKEYKLLQAAP